MKTILSLVALLCLTAAAALGATPPADAPSQPRPEAQSAQGPPSLQEKVLLADLIAVVEVRSLTVEHASETYERHKAICELKDILKGQVRDNRKQVEVILNLLLAEPATKLDNATSAHGAQKSRRQTLLLAEPATKLDNATSAHSAQKSRRQALKPQDDPPADRLKADGQYILFLEGDWSYQPIAPRGGIVPLAPQYAVEGKTLSQEEYLAKVRDLIKGGPRIRRVGIHVVTPSGWSADFRVHSGGKTNGGHMSGGDRPFHHMEKGALKGEALKAIIDQADAVYNSDAPSQPVIRTNELVYIQIEPFAGKAKVYQRKIKEAFSDKGLVELDRLLHEHRIGAW